MIFTEEWLRQYVNPALGTDELADALTMAGLEVEEVRTIAPAFSGVVVGEVLSCRDHENSDHLHVCEVNAGTGETLQIVCGAPNVRAGIKVACATIGAVLPGDFRIKRASCAVWFRWACSVRRANSASTKITMVFGSCPMMRRWASISVSTHVLTMPRSNSSSPQSRRCALRGRRRTRCACDYRCAAHAASDGSGCCHLLLHAPGGCSGARPLRPLYEPNSSRPECCRADAGLMKARLSAAACVRSRLWSIFPTMSCSSWAVRRTFMI